MNTLSRRTKSRLKRLGIGIETPDTDTVVLRSVPANPSQFNKPATNLLLKRARRGLPLVVAVDDDLQYLGSDSVLRRLFTAGPTRSGWRFLPFSQHALRGPDEVVTQALAILGQDGSASTQPEQVTPGDPKERPSMIDGVGHDLSAALHNGNAEVTVGRQVEIDDVTACLLRWGQARFPLICGPSGVGKTNLLHAVARRLAVCRSGIHLILIDLSHLFAGSLFEAERERILSDLVGEALAGYKTVLAFERMELALAGLPNGPLVLADALDHGLRAAGTMLPESAPRIPEPLDRRCDFIRLSEPSAQEMPAILQSVRDAIARHHRVKIDSPVVASCLRHAEVLPGHLPAKAIRLLDTAAAHARLAGANAIGPEDIEQAASKLAGSIRG